MLIDLHVHSSVSDGTDTPTRLVFQAVRAGLSAIALCDHDTFDGLAEARAAGLRVGLQVLPGIEISSTLGGRSVHLLGYGCRPTDPALNAELVRLRTARAGRIPTMLDKLAELGYPISREELVAAAGATPSVGRPHIADAMVARGYVVDRQEAFERFLNDGGPAYVTRYATPLVTAISLVNGAGGVPVLAHPWARGMDAVLTAHSITELAESYGLEGLEVDHPDHDARTRDLLTQLGYRTGLIRTGSSDYHGTGKRNNPLGACTTRGSGYHEILQRIKAKGGVVPG